MLHVFLVKLDLRLWLLSLRVRGGYRPGHAAFPHLSGALRTPRSRLDDLCNFEESYASMPWWMLAAQMLVNIADSLRGDLVSVRNMVNFRGL